MIRILRIAFTATCVIASLLFVVLWVRSYSRWDSPFGRVLGNWSVQINSLEGYLFVGVYDKRPGSEWRWRTFPAPFVVGWGYKERLGALGFGVDDSNQTRFVYMPYWFLAALPAALAAAPWFRWSTRFSLRTLLIAATLIALVLGIIAAAT